MLGNIWKAHDSSPWQNNFINGIQIHNQSPWFKLMAIYLSKAQCSLAIDGIAENYFISSSSIGIVHTQGTKLNLEVTQGDYKTLMTC